MSTLHVGSLPDLRVKLDGRPLEAAARRALVSATVRQCANRPTVCELVFAAGGSAPLTLPAEPGTAVQLHTGSAVDPLFTGAIAAIDRRFGPLGLVEVGVSACDALQNLRARQPLRVFADLDCAGLARRLVEHLDLSVDVAEAGPRVPRRVQFRQTDHDLLEEECARAGLRFFLDGRTLRLSTADGDGTRITRRIGRDVLALELVRDASVPPCTNVEAQGFHADGQQSVFGAFYDDVILDTGADFDGVFRLTGETLATSEEAAAHATAVRDRHVGLRDHLTGEVEGDPALRPGVALEIEGVPGEGTVRHVLSEVVHRFDAEAGYVCTVGSRPPETPPVRHRAPLLTYGDVVAIDDPDAHGRVRVRLPAFGDLESDWLAVTVPAAGDGKGVCALPDVGDRVLVVFANLDLAWGVVLGGVFGAGRPPEPGAPQAQARSFTLRTARGHVVHLDDDADVLRLSDRTGSTVELGPERVVLHAKVDLEITAPGRQMVLSADRIDFRRQ